MIYSRKLLTNPFSLILVFIGFFMLLFVLANPAFAIDSCSMVMKDLSGNNVSTLVRGQSYQGIGNMTGNWDGGCSDCTQSRSVTFSDSSQAYNQNYGGDSHPAPANPEPDQHGVWNPVKQDPNGTGPFTSTFTLNSIPPGSGIMQLETTKKGYYQRKVLSTLNINNVSSSKDKQELKIKWEGKIIAGYTETYTIELEYTTTDRVTMNFDGDTKIYDQNASKDGHTKPESKSFNVNLVAGQSYSFKINFQAVKDGGKAKLFWKTLTMPKQIIPETNLHQDGYEPPLGTTYMVMSLTQDLNDLQGGPSCFASQQVTVVADPSSLLVPGPFNITSLTTACVANKPQNTLSWEASANVTPTGSPTGPRYIVERSTSPTSGFTALNPPKLDGINTFLDNDPLLGSSTTYYYRVQAINSQGSTYANTQSILTGACSPLPTVDLKLVVGLNVYDTPPALASGTNASLQWTTTNSPTSCSATANPANPAWNGSVGILALNSAPLGTLVNPPSGVQQFSIFCTNAAGSSPIDTVNVTVNEPIIAPVIETTGGDVHSNYDVDVQ